MNNVQKQAVVKGYKSCIYDSKSNQIHLKEYDSDNFQIFDYNHWFYLRSETETGLKDIYGNNVKKVISGRKIDPTIYNITYEHNITPVSKFLEERYFGQELSYDKSQFNIAFIDIECGDSDDGTQGFPYPEQAKNEINLISMYSSKTDTFTTFAYQDYTGGKIAEIGDINWDYRKYDNEQRMLEAFSNWFSEQKFDFLTGWNIEHFDIPYIIQRYKTKGMPEKWIKKFSPFGKVKVGEGISRRMQNKVTEVKIEGLTVITYEDLYSKFSGAGKPESWSLQWFGMEFLGEGKLDLEGSMNDTYKKNWNQFVQYNVQDVNLVKRLDERFKYIQIAITMCLSSRVTFDKVLAVSHIITGAFLEYLHENNQVLQDEGPKQPDWWLEEEWYKTKDNMGSIYYQNCREGETTFPEYHCKGAIVEANPGLYHKCISWDIKSSYPFQIQSYLISPENKVIEKDMDIKLSQQNIGTLFTTGQIYNWLMKIHNMNSAIEDSTDDLSIKKLKNLKYPKMNSLEFYDHINAMIEKEFNIGNALYDFQNDVIISPINGVYYKRNYNALIPSVVRRKFALRKEYSKIAKEAEIAGDKLRYENYDALQYSTKILINSMYGVLLLKKGFALADVDNARVITRGGRQCLRWLGQKGEEYIRDVLPRKLCKLLGKTDVPEITGRIWTHSDTDSCYFSFDEHFQKICPDMPYREFMETVDKLMESAFEKILYAKAQNERIENLIQFPREKYIDHLIVMAKKKYIMKVSDKEGIRYDPPKNAYTGVELKRSDTPDWVKEKVTEGIDILLASSNIDPLKDFTVKCWKEFKTASWDEIARKQGVGKYNKFAPEFDEELPEEKLGATMSSKAAINYNWMLNKFNPGLIPIEQGNRIKYLVLKKNQFNFDVMGWQGKCPLEFFKKYGIEPDLNDTFEKTFNSLLSRIVEAVGWLPKGSLIPKVKGLFE